MIVWQDFGSFKNGGTMKFVVMLIMGGLSFSAFGHEIDLTGKYACTEFSSSMEVFGGADQFLVDSFDVQLNMPRLVRTLNILQTGKEFDIRFVGQFSDEEINYFDEDFGTLVANGVEEREEYPADEMYLDGYLETISAQIENHALKATHYETENGLVEGSDMNNNPQYRTYFTTQGETEFSKTGDLLTVKLSLVASMPKGGHSFASGQAVAKCRVVR